MHFHYIISQNVRKQIALNKQNVPFTIFSLEILFPPVSIMVCIYIRHSNMLPSTEMKAVEKRNTTVTSMLPFPIEKQENTNYKAY